MTSIGTTFGSRLFSQNQKSRNLTNKVLDEFISLTGNKTENSMNKTFEFNSTIFKKTQQEEFASIPMRTGVYLRSQSHTELIEKEFSVNKKQNYLQTVNNLIYKKPIRKIEVNRICPVNKLPQTGKTFTCSLKFNLNLKFNVDFNSAIETDKKPITVIKAKTPEIRLALIQPGVNYTSRSYVDKENISKNNEKKANSNTDKIINNIKSRLDQLKDQSRYMNKYIRQKGNKPLMKDEKSKYKIEPANKTPDCNNLIKVVSLITVKKANNRNKENIGLKQTISK